MREVMLDVHELGVLAQGKAGRVQGHVLETHPTGRPRPAGELGRSDDPPPLLARVPLQVEEVIQGSELAAHRNRHDVEVSDLEAGMLEAVPDAPNGEPGEVLDPREALLGDIGDDPAIQHQGGTRVVSDVYAEDFHRRRGTLTLTGRPPRGRRRSGSGLDLREDVDDAARRAPVPSRRDSALAAARRARSARARSAIRSGARPSSTFVPSSTVTGRSVLSRRVKQGTPR